jgi:ATP phosphoribosyltransferase
MDTTKLTIGMPAGSLANPTRGGNLIKLLEDSGFKTAGYEAGGPSVFKTVNFLYGWDGRPQEFSSQLALEELDVAIAGDDWIEERINEFKLEYNTIIELERVLPLNRGGVKLVGIVKGNVELDTTEAYLNDLTEKQDMIVVVTEMPYLALNWIRNVLERIDKLDEYNEFSVQKYKSPSKIKKGVLIYETWGKTEAKILNGGADIGLEITQSGSAIKNYGLKILETVYTSQTSVWINPKLKQDEEKLELLKMFLLNIYGSINAENKVLVTFNVKNANRDIIENYLNENNLFADEPTMSIGKTYTVYNIQVDTSGGKVPLAMVRYHLAKLGATNIDTLPIQSSIQGLDALKL